jgi:hypothetical protein
MALQAGHGAAITPNSSTDLTRFTEGGIFVSGAGNLVVTLVGMDDGTSITFPSLASQYHPLIAKRIWATSTATGIIALY